MRESVEPTEAEIDAVVEEFGSDLRAAIRALLNDLAVLAQDQAVTVSRGYVRGRWLALSDARRNELSGDFTGKLGSGR